MDAAAFFRVVRDRAGPLNQSQVVGFDTVLAAIAGAPLAHAAYMLATAWHETAKTMQPVAERGGTAYFTRMYDVAGERPKTCIAYGNTCAGDGPKYRGRGYVQLTWKVNYQRATDELGFDFVGDPDLAMHPAHAADIMVHGMRGGWFSGKRLATYLPTTGTATRAQYVAARRIINGTDRAELVEDYAQMFERALIAAGWPK